MRIVIALGGNAMTAPTARPVRAISRPPSSAPPARSPTWWSAGHQLLLTHGNGPQVGNLLVKNELAAAVVPPVPLDWCGAQTQATIGVLLLNALDAALAARGMRGAAAALVSRTLVDRRRSGLRRPDQADRALPARSRGGAVMIGHGQIWQDRGERGWRRVVASPEPLALPGRAGRGRPAGRRLPGRVLRRRRHSGRSATARSSYRGVEAVIDKDLTAALLARAVDADVLVIATDVEHAVLGFGTDARRAARPDRGRRTERAALPTGEFAGGSMGPKVGAACRFVAGTGGLRSITSLSRIAAAAARAGRHRRGSRTD